MPAPGAGSPLSHPDSYGTGRGLEAGRRGSGRSDVQCHGAEEDLVASPWGKHQRTPTKG